MLQVLSIGECNVHIMDEVVRDIRGIIRIFRMQSIYCGEITVYGNAIYCRAR